MAGVLQGVSARHHDRAGACVGLAHALNRHGTSAVVADAQRTAQRRGLGLEVGDRRLRGIQRAQVLAAAVNRLGGHGACDRRFGVVATLIGEGLDNIRAAIGDGVGVGNLPVAIVCLGLGQRRSDGKGLAAGGSEKVLHIVIARECTSDAGIARMNVRLVLRPEFAGLQCRSGRRSHRVRVCPILRVPGTILIGVNVAYTSAAGSSSQFASCGRTLRSGGLDGVAAVVGNHRDCGRSN